MNGGSVQLKGSQWEKRRGALPGGRGPLRENEGDRPGKASQARGGRQQGTP